MIKNVTFALLFVVMLIFNLNSTTIAQNYFPTEIGNTWILESQDKSERITYTIETSDETINDIELLNIKTVTETLGTDVAMAQEIFVDINEEGIYVYKYVVEIDDIFGVATALLYPPQLFYPTSLTLGDTWQISAESELNIVGPFTFISTNEVIDVEDVVTPVGTFEDCLKIRLRTRSISAGGITPATSYQWLAPDFGPVKFENSQDIVYELISSNLLYDVNRDGNINILDLVFVGTHFGEENTLADVNRDGEVNILDLVLVAQNFDE